MPTKLDTTLSLPVDQRLEEFRQTIPDGVGYDMEELASLPDLHASQSHVERICRQRGWTVSRFDTRKNRMVAFLVNERTLKLYAAKPTRNPGQPAHGGSKAAAGKR